MIGSNAATFFLIGKLNQSNKLFGTIYLICSYVFFVNRKNNLPNLLGNVFANLQAAIVTRLEIERKK